MGRMSKKVCILASNTTFLFWYDPDSGCDEIKICFASFLKRKDFSMFRDQRSNLDCVYTQQKGLYTHKMMYNQRRKTRNTPLTAAPDPFPTRSLRGYDGSHKTRDYTRHQTTSSFFDRQIRICPDESRHNEIRKGGPTT